MTGRTAALGLAASLGIATAVGVITWRDWSAPLLDARRVPCALYEDNDRGELIARGTLLPNGACRVHDGILLAWMDTHDMPIRLCWVERDGLHCQSGHIGHPVELTPLDE